MSSRTIRITIVIATILFIGITITQVYWVRQAFIREEVDFQRNVGLALYETSKNYYEITRTPSPVNNPVMPLSSNKYVVMLNSPIDTNLLEALLKTSFSLHNLFTDFEYSVYESTSPKPVFVKIVTVGEDDLLESRSGLPVFDKSEYYFDVKFPSKRSFVIDQMRVWMFSTLMLVILILFFSYALFVILKQKRLSEIQKDFINNMTHEFKTPISTIAIASNVLKEPGIKERPERLLKYATIIENENKRLRNQVDKVMQIASIDKVTLDLKKEEIDMHTLIIQAISQMQLSLESGSIKENLNASNPIVKADPVHIANVIHNLLENAIKYCEKEPEIQLSTDRTSGNFIVSFSDNGRGIPEEHQKAIFDKFYRVPTGDVHDVKGFGIGLHYVKLIMEAHGGSVTLNSTVGKGSTFIISLPQ